MPEDSAPPSTPIEEPVPALAEAAPQVETSVGENLDSRLSAGGGPSSGGRGNDKVTGGNDTQQPAPEPQPAERVEPAPADDAGATEKATVPASQDAPLSATQATVPTDSSVPASAVEPPLETLPLTGQGAPIKAHPALAIPSDHSAPLMVKEGRENDTRQFAAPSPKSFLAKALERIQFRKRAKLEKIVNLAKEKRSLTNDQVEKLLRVSDSTASRYLNTLVKQGRLRVTGTGNFRRYEPLGGSNGGN